MPLRTTLIASLLVAAGAGKTTLGYSTGGGTSLPLGLNPSASTGDWEIPGLDALPARSRRGTRIAAARGRGRVSTTRPRENTRHKRKEQAFLDTRGFSVACSGQGDGRRRVRARRPQDRAQVADRQGVAAGVQRAASFHDVVSSARVEAQHTEQNTGRTPRSSSRSTC